MKRFFISQQIEAISFAVNNKNFAVQYKPASNIRPSYEIDGKCYYTISKPNKNNYGSNTIEVAGQTFTCNLANGEISGELFDELDAELDDIMANSYIEQIKNILSKANGFIARPQTTSTQQIKTYELMTKTKIADRCLPTDNENSFDTTTINGKDYYILNSHYNDDHTILALPTDQKKNSDGSYTSCLIQTTPYKNICLIQITPYKDICLHPVPQKQKNKQKKQNSYFRLINNL